MNKKVMFKVMSMVGLVLSGIGTILSGWADEQKMNETITEKVHEAIADIKK